MRDDPVVVELVLRARGGDKAAWDEIVERFAPLVWSICRRYRLGRADAEDVGGGVWLRLVEHLDAIREPAALAGWLARTTERECLAVLRTSSREQPIDEDRPPRDPAPAPALDEALLLAERNDALRAALTELPARCRQLLTMLFADPPAPYADIETKLSMKHGAIGPSRARCLARLRRSRQLARLIDTETNRPER
ncbi:MAG TPA: sigma-70 family RNA polymerase sigma factor [Mycobacteriales bacterium]|nr:sigma-70 family RNA polymerase sigma factor [Mycobacteriales bacterium]